MDTGEGKFEFVDDPNAMKALEERYPDHGGWFRVGEVVELKGSRFRVKSVKPRELRLKLLPKQKLSGITTADKGEENEQENG